MKTPTTPTEREPKRYGFDEWGGNFKMRPDGFMVALEDYDALLLQLQEARQERDVAVQCGKTTYESMNALDRALTASVARSRELEGIVELGIRFLRENGDPGCAETLVQKLNAEPKPDIFALRGVMKPLSPTAPAPERPWLEPVEEKVWHKDAPAPNVNEGAGDRD
jgi:hypothetical protein